MKPISAEPFLPCEYIADELAARGKDAAWLARAVGTTEEGIGHLLANRVLIDDELAKRLGRAFGTNAEIWSNLQASYDAAKEALAKRLLRRLRKMRGDIHDTILMAEWWNDNRPEHPPFDCESDRLALVKVDECIRCVEERRPIPSGTWGAVFMHLEEAAKAN